MATVKSPLASYDILVQSHKIKIIRKNLRKHMANQNYKGKIQHAHTRRWELELS